MERRLFFGAALSNDTVSTSPSLVGPINPIWCVHRRRNNEIVVDPTNADNISFRWPGVAG